MSEESQKEEYRAAAEAAVEVAPPAERAVSHYDDYAEEEDETTNGGYDITATPNDFNVLTLNSYVQSGAIRMPGFQRNFVWDIKRASKLMESLILGLPVPQLFLYEEGNNKFLVIDGQQRLMSVYYFIAGRFPRPAVRGGLRRYLTVDGRIPQELLQDDKLFQPFKLQFVKNTAEEHNPLSGLGYETLDENRSKLDLRPLRSVVIRQNSPSDGDTSIYEIFNRLNTGGVNLRPQEIRTCMYHSGFYDMLDEVNLHPQWRSMLGKDDPDKNMKDIEILLRGIAMLVKGEQYAPSMIRFLNEFSQKSKSHSGERNDYLRKLFESFLQACEGMPEGIFIKDNNRFNIALYEAVFTVACKKAHAENRMIEHALNWERISELRRDDEFSEASRAGTTSTANVKIRLARAQEIVGSL